MQRPVLVIQELFPEMELRGIGFDGGGLSIAWQLVCDPWGNLGVRSFCIDDQQWDIMQGGHLLCSVLCLKLCCINTLSNFVQQCIFNSACVLAGNMTQIYNADPEFECRVMSAVREVNAVRPRGLDMGLSYGWEGSGRVSLRQRCLSRGGEYAEQFPWSHLGR